MQDHWAKKVEEMPTTMQQARFMELARKISDMVILSKEELAEIIALRESLQKTAQQQLDPRD